MVNCPVISVEYAAPRVTCSGNWLVGSLVAGSPEIVMGGVGGRLIIRVKLSCAVLSALSITVITTNEKVPAAVGMPLICPVLELMVSPLGSPFADQV